MAASGTTRIAAAVGSGSATALRSLTAALPGGVIEGESWFNSGIHVAGLALVGISLAYLAGIAFLAGGTWSIGRSLLLIVAGGMCFTHMPWGIKTAKTACVGGMFLDVRFLLSDLMHLGIGRYVLTEMVHVTILGICLYLLNHDGAPNLRPWYRSLAIACGLYLIMLVVCATGVRQEISDFEKQIVDEYAKELITNGAQPASPFIAGAERTFGNMPHAASVDLLRNLERAGALDARAADVHEDIAGALVVKLPTAGPRRDAVRQAVAAANHESEPLPDTGEGYAVIEFAYRMPAPGTDKE